MTDTQERTHQDDCLMCTVRALTEGDPAAKWTPDTKGQSVSGVVLRKGELATEFGRVPFVDLWTGGTGRIRIMAYGAALRHTLDQAAALIGDRLEVWYDGEGTLPAKGRQPERTYRKYSANVQRGH